MNTIVALLVATLVSSAANAQTRDVWTYDQLMAKADCVVIGEVVNTKETGRTTHPDLKYPSVQFDTEFKVQTTLKPCGSGGVTGAAIHLTYYAPDFERLQQGVIPSDSVLNFVDGNAYLLFLKRTNGAEYEPVSGNTWPTMSVYPLAKPGER
jgi:hypothetical protein